jgi:hypothetical protein
MAVVADRYFVSEFNKDFKDVEKQRIIVSNKLATAKIVHENLNHVRELVFMNMDFPGRDDSIPRESLFFDFLTTCVNDLKLKLVSVNPLRPATHGRVTTWTYDIVIQGDFFTFGELCAKLENSRRIVATESFNVSLLDDGERAGYRNVNKGIEVKMRVNTYTVKKNRHR